MTSRTIRERLIHLSPLVLRLGVAVVLALDGLQRVAAPGGPGGQVITASASGFAVNASWSVLIGVAEAGLAALLAAGFLTRLAALPLLVGAGYALAQTLPQPPSGAPSHLPPEPHGMGLLLLTAAAAALLLSGSGSLGVDSFFLRRGAARSDARAASTD